MIGIVGYMSSGKTYFAVEQIVKYLAQGHRVATNIKLLCQGVTSATLIPCIFWKQLYYYLSDDESGYHVISCADYEHYPHGSPRGSRDYDRNLCYCFLDEASSIFDSMVHASDSNITKVAAWARHTEKRGIRVFLIMQFESELHKRLRVHITEYIKCASTNNVKLPFFGTGVPRPFKGISLRRAFLPDGETPYGPIKAVKFNPSVYNCYCTSQIVVGENDVSPFVPVYINRDVKTAHNAAAVGVLFLFLFLVVQFSFIVWWFVNA